MYDGRVIYETQFFCQEQCTHMKICLHHKKWNPDDFNNNDIEPTLDFWREGDSVVVVCDKFKEKNSE